MTFKRGQIVWCKNIGRYLQTDYHVKCRVLDVEHSTMMVRIIEGRDRGNEWRVDCCEFDVVSARVI